MMKLLTSNVTIQYYSILNIITNPTYTMESTLRDGAANPYITDIQEHLNIVPNYSVQSSETVDTCETSKSHNSKVSTVMECVQLNTHTTDSSIGTADNLMCLNKSEQFLNSFENSLCQPKKYSKKTFDELQKFSLKQLQVLIEDLTQSVERVSSELVKLLLENDALQQESDARNIAIEQLLKLTVKVNENELKPIQMSVVFPDDECDDA